MSDSEENENNEENVNDNNKVTNIDLISNTYTDDETDSEFDYYQSDNECENTRETNIISCNRFMIGFF